MFNIFNGFNSIDVIEVVFEQYVGNQLVQKQQMSGPVVLLQAQFMQMMEQISRVKQPTRIRMVRYDSVWDKFDGQRKQIENSIEFKNWRVED